MGGTKQGYHYFAPFDTCQRQFWWQSIRRVQLREVNPQASLGRMIHHAMFFMYQGDSFDKALDLAQLAEEKEIRDNGWVIDAEDFRAICAELHRLMGWYQQWQPKYPLKMIAGEREGSIPIIGTNDEYTFRIDSIGEDVLGQLWVVDVKSTKKTFANLFREFEMSYQMMGYVLGARHIGFPVRGAVIRAFRKLKGVGHPNELFQDERFEYSKAQLNEFMENQKDVRYEINEKLDLIEEMSLEPIGKEFFRKNPSQCFSIRGTCPYHILCRYPETEEASLAAYYVESQDHIKEEGGEGGRLE